MIRRKKENRFSKVVMLVILVMVTIGFTLPGFLEFGDEGGEVVGEVEERVCQRDEDCYLMCDGSVVAVLCYQNMCKQNACFEESFYPFVEEPLTFELEMVVDGSEVDLEEKSNDKDVFVTFIGGEIQLFSSNLRLKHVLEKAGFVLGAEGVEVWVNGEQHYAYGEYRPKEGDKIKVIYGGAGS